MRVVFLLIAIFVVYCIFLGIRFYSLVSVSAQLVQKAKAYDVRPLQSTQSILVLGDSSAVGVGAGKPEDTIAGLLAKKIGAEYVENVAVSGSKTEDVQAQYEKAALGHYTLALVMIGGNDITHLVPADTAVSNIKLVLTALKTRADRVIFISAGNIGAATIIPWPFRHYFTVQNLKYHAAFQKLADDIGVEYVNEYAEPSVDPFILHPETYLATDGFHPSSAGYVLWYERIK